MLMRFTKIGRGITYSNLQLDLSSCGRSRCQRRQLVLGRHSCRAQSWLGVRTQSSAAIEERQHSQRLPSNSAVLQGWSGLTEWRLQNDGVDRRRIWAVTHCEEGPAVQAAAAGDVQLPASLAECAVLVLNTADPELKAALSHRIWEAHCGGDRELGRAVPPRQPARPALPKLVSPREIPTAKASPLPLNVYLLHNLAHVELNAIDLAWDTVARFAHLNLPKSFYLDFAHIADDESRHFGWCCQRLRELDASYGCMNAHEVLWRSAQMSADDIGARLALVPMGAEARGLDVAPRLVQRLMSFNDHPSAAIVDLIGQQERAHVAVGVLWFQRMAAAQGEDAGAAYRGWLSALCPDLLTGSLNHGSRQEVGMQREWYDTSLWPVAGVAPAAATPTAHADLRALRARLAELLEDCSDLSCPA